MIARSPRVSRPRVGHGAARALYALAEARFAAATAQTRGCASSASCGPRLRAQLGGDGAALAAISAGAPSVDVARHLWRALDAAWRERRAPRTALAVTVFAMPLVIVAGREGAGGDGVLPASSPIPAKLAAILREHGALAGNRTFALADALVAAEAIDVARLPEILAWRRLPDALRAGIACRARARRRRRSRSRGARGACTCASSSAPRSRNPGPISLADTRRRASGASPFTRELARQLAPAGARCWRCRARRSAPAGGGRRGASRSARCRRRSSRATPSASFAARSASRPR